MDTYETINDLKKDYDSQEITRMDAIDVLQDQFGYSSREAEALVDGWG